MANNRWMIAAVAALALGACRTAGDKGTASAGEPREDERVVAAQGDEEREAAAQADDDRREVAQQDPMDEAAEQAPSTRPQSGVGSQSPHPMPEENAEGEEVFSGNAPQEPTLEGRVPESRQGDADAEAQASATGTPEASGTATAGTAAESGATASAGTGAPASGTATPSEVSGRVALVDEDTREIAIDSGTATTQVKIAEDAQILVDGEKGDLGDVKQGAEVRASLDQGAEAQEATRVEVTSSRK